MNIEFLYPVIWVVLGFCANRDINTYIFMIRMRAAVSVHSYHTNQMREEKNKSAATWVRKDTDL